MFDRPANTFVAGFVGSPAMNLCRLALGENGSVAFGDSPLAVPARSNGRTSIVVGVRPEAMELASDGVPAAVEAIEELGSDAYLYCAAEMEGTPVRLVARVPARQAPERGAGVHLRPSADHEPHVFDADTGERI
jgi:multiple sugar transport system ATP-binding protein